MRVTSEYRRLCGTAKSRSRLAVAVKALAAECGAAIIDRECTGAREIPLVLAIGDWRCMLCFDGASHVDAFLGHWYSDNYNPDDKLPRHFGLPIRGSENPYHRRKATTCTDTFEDFKASLRTGLTALRAHVAVS